MMPDRHVHQIHAVAFRTVVERIDARLTEIGVPPSGRLEKRHGSVVIGDILRQGVIGTEEFDCRERLVLFYNLSDVGVRSMIQVFKSLGIPKPIFAVVTETSITWTLQQLMEHLIERARHLNVPHIILEVIQGNTPAERLFGKLGFCSTRELLNIRRPPGPPTRNVGPYEFQMLDHQRALELLQQRQDYASWLTDTPSLRNAGSLSALHVEIRSGGRG